MVKDEENKMSQVKLKIPATSANLGLGFDSMGVAVDKFLTIEAVESEESQWSFTFLDEPLKVLPSDQSNLVAQTALQVAEKYGKEMPALKVSMASTIPLAHGLGSSSSAIVAGIELADAYCQLKLSHEDKIYTGTEIEGHPDNIGPCFTGGVFVGYFNQGDFAYKTLTLDGISLIVSIPAYEISTEEVRSSLPKEYSSQEAVMQNAKNNVMLLAMVERDYETMGRLMMEDHFHEPYRGPLIKEFEPIKERALAAGAYATVISGAGPTLLTLCPEDQADDIFQALSAIDSCQHEKVKVYYQD